MDLPEKNALSGENPCSTLLDTFPCIFWEGESSAFRFTYVSSGADKLLGYPREEWLAHPDFLDAHTHPDDVGRVGEALRRVAATGGDEEVHFRMIRPDGETIWLHNLIRAVQLDGQSRRLRGVMTDVTTIKARDDHLKLQSFSIENLPEQVICAAADGRIRWVNDVACQRLGYTREELLNLSIIDIAPSLTPERWQEHWALTREGSRKVRTVHKGRGGDFYPVEIVTNFFVHDGVDYNCSIIRDLSEQKRLEKALQDSEEEFRTLCDLAPIGIFRADVNGNNTYMNRKWEEIMGISAAEGINKGWTLAAHPDDRDTLLRVWHEATTSGSFYSHESRILTPGGEVKWVRALGNAVRNAEGKVAGYIGTVEDITQLRQARQEIIKTQKLESLGILAGGIAHDFNNILTIILGNISLARLQLHDPVRLTKRLEDAERATGRARDLSQQLLTFAKGGEPIKKVFDLSGILKETVEQAVRGTNVRCQFALSDHLWPAEADEGQFLHVVNNLIQNAVQAMPDGGTVTVAAENATSLAAGKKFVKIAITDTGVGIPEHHLQQIFDPYFTTKEQRSGLGLATCHSIISKHGGRIWAVSTLGKGSTFYFSLPAGDHKTAPAPRVSAPAPRRGCRILVMEDEEPVREVVHAMLEELGFSVECTEDGAEAVELYRQRKEQGRPFSAVILDLTIPGGMGGKETIARLIELDPEVKAVVSSGYSNDPVMANYWKYGFNAVLSKPYRPQDMEKVLEELLEL